MVSGWTITHTLKPWKLNIYQLLAEATDLTQLAQPSTNSDHECHSIQSQWRWMQTAHEACEPTVNRLVILNCWSLPICCVIFPVVLCITKMLFPALCRSAPLDHKPSESCHLKHCSHKQTLLSETAMCCFVDLLLPGYALLLYMTCLISEKKTVRATHSVYIYIFFFQQRQMWLSDWCSQAVQH